MPSCRPCRCHVSRPNGADAKKHKVVKKKHVAKATTGGPLPCDLVWLSSLGNVKAVQSCLATGIDTELTDKQVRCGCEGIIEMTI